MTTWGGITTWGAPPTWDGAAPVLGSASISIGTAPYAAIANGTPTLGG